VADEGVEYVARRMEATRSAIDALLHARDRLGAMPPEFPRSRLMRSLMDTKVLTAVAVGAVVVLALNPRLGAQVLRKVPLRQVAMGLVAAMAKRRNVTEGSFVHVD
jgi:hypothetical protein